MGQLKSRATTENLADNAAALAEIARGVRGDYLPIGRAESSLDGLPIDRELKVFC